MSHLFYLDSKLFMKYIQWFSFILACSCLTACDDSEPQKNGGSADMSLSGVEQSAGEQNGGAQAGEEQAGETQAGETQAGETPAGETQAGETQAGEMVAGENLAGASVIDSSEWAKLDFAWEHGCGISNHGQVSCWGRNQQGQASPSVLTDRQTMAIELDKLKRISTGRYHSCLEFEVSSVRTEQSNEDLDQDSASQSPHQIICWGRSLEGQLDPPENLNLSHISAGWRESCALDTDGQAHCWGELNPNTLPSSQLRLKSIELSQGFGCGLDKNNASIHCWGRNEYRQASPPNGEDYKALSVGTGKHNCAIAPDNLVRCWGDSADGKTLAPAVQFKQLSVGKDHACALALDDTVRCWGVNRHGESSAPSGTFKWVSAGPHFSCALRTEGNLVCWGALKPEASPLFTQVSIGLAHSCALKVDQSLSCWGWPRAGRTEPPTGQFLEVGVGDEHSCALSLEGEVLCWGLGLDPNRFERDGDFDQSYLPEFDEGIKAISVGALHNCALSESGQVTCWGSNQSGQTNVPEFPWEVIQIESGRSHSCARSSQGEVLCWGDNRLGQLDLPARQGNESPESFNYLEIDLGGDTSCALTQDQFLTCRGKQEQEIGQERFSHITVSEEVFCSRPQETDEEQQDQITRCESRVRHSSNSPELWLFELDSRQINSLESGYGQACVIRADERIRCQGQHAPNTKPINFE